MHTLDCKKWADRMSGGYSFKYTVECILWAVVCKCGRVGYLGFGLFNVKHYLKNCCVYDVCVCACVRVCACVCVRVCVCACV